MEHKPLDSYKTNLFYSPKCGSKLINNIINFYIYKLAYKDFTQAKPQGTSFRHSLIYKKINNEYKNILICRNPYDKAASLFFSKYIDNDYYNKFYKPRNFTEFVETLYSVYKPYCKKNIGSLEVISLEKDNRIDISHSLPQFAFYGGFKFDSIYTLENFSISSFLKEFEIYEEEALARKKIEHVGKSNILYNSFLMRDYITGIDNLYDLDYNKMVELKRYCQKNKLRPKYSELYNDSLSKKIEDIYYIDFEYLKQNGIHYDRYTNARDSCDA